MESKDYEVSSFKPGDFVDPHGNYWCEAAFKGVSEPVRWVVKDPTSVQVGQVVYGRVTDETSKAGKPYLRFRREQKEDNERTTQTYAPKKEWQPRDDDRIAAQWALGRSYEKHGATTEAIVDAQWLYKNIATVSGSEINNPAPASGYEKAKAAHQQIKAKVQPEEPADPEFASMLSKGMEADGIPMDQIPF